MQNIFQHTIKNKVTCSGIGVHSGKISNLTFYPAPTDTGIKYIRSDIKNKNNIIPANYKNVHKTTLGTTLTNEEQVEIATIEHLMAALWAVNIDNCLIESDNIETPILDGSSEPFVFLLKTAGIKKQDKKRKYLKIIKDFAASSQKDPSITSSFQIDDDFIIDFTIEFSNKIIGKDNYVFINKDNCFIKDIARARTFGMFHEVEYLRKNNLALGGSLENAIVVDDDKILNPGGLRIKQEFVKHKILDSIGDLYLAGYPIIGKFQGFRSGHDLNNQLLHKLFSDKDNYKFVNF
jgi:UDP-3-O-[3-hydroxymyristoyl] N-acetylglucosamine deacetylase